MNEIVSASEINRIASVIEQGPYEEYPTLENRLFLGAMGLRLAADTNTLFVPDGPWEVKNHSNRHGKPDGALDPEVPSPEKTKIDDSLSERWRSGGLLLDQYGRPIHPNWQQLLADERIGLPTGTGFFWRYGPNATVDPVVYRQFHEGDDPELLLIKRLKGGRWALPGGFIDREDAAPSEAARREAGEETHLEDIGGTDEIILHKVPVGLRDTLHAWTENTVVLIHGDQDYLFDTEPSPGDDAVDVGWFRRDQIAQLDIFDAHAEYIDLAYSRIAS